jgi:hypothetical protein
LDTILLNGNNIAIVRAPPQRLRVLCCILRTR